MKTINFKENNTYVFVDRDNEVVHEPIILNKDNLTKTLLSFGFNPIRAQKDLQILGYSVNETEVFTVEIIS